MRAGWWLCGALILESIEGCEKAEMEENRINYWEDYQNSQQMIRIPMRRIKEIRCKERKKVESVATVVGVDAEPRISIK